MKTSNLILLIFSIFLAFSCNDACDLVDCGQNGICNDGSCECDPGYDGKFCENQFCAAEFFEGSYKGKLTCYNSPKKLPYDLTLKKISESIVNLEFEDGESIDFELDFSNCSSSNLGDATGFGVIKYTLSLVDNDVVELKVEPKGFVFENCDCFGTLKLK